MDSWYEGLLLVFAFVGAVYMVRGAIDVVYGFRRSSPELGLSILIIEANQGAFLEGFFRTLMWQLSSLPPAVDAEVVVVDQGSDSETRDVLHRLARKHGVLTVCYSEPRGLQGWSGTDVQLGYSLCRYPLVVVAELHNGTVGLTLLRGLIDVVSALRTRGGRICLLQRRN